MQEINAAGGVAGHKLVVTRYDSGSDPRQAAVAARKLIQDDKVLAIIGPFSSGETLVAVNDAERAHVVMMPAAASTPGLSAGKKYLFRLAQDEAVQFDRMLQTLRIQNIPTDKAAIIYISDEAVDAFAGTKIYPELMDKYGIKHEKHRRHPIQVVRHVAPGRQAASRPANPDRNGSTARAGRQGHP